MSKFSITIFVLSIFIVLYANSVFSLSISEINNVYNLQDNLVFSVAPAENGILTIEFICSGQSELIYKQYVENTASVDINQPLEKKFLDNIPGVGCKLIAKIENILSESNVFSVSDDINAALSFNDENINPSESLDFSATAIKANSAEASGFFEFYIANTNLSLNGTFEKGKFSGTILLPADFKAGNYPVSVNVYERDDQGQISNQGNVISKINVKQKPKNLEIVLNKQDFIPGEKINFKVLLLDQTNEQISDKNINLAIEDPQATEFSNKQIKSSTDNEFETQTNFSFGFWKIKAMYTDDANMTTERVFNLSELKLACFKISGDLLKVNNCGNIPYEGEVQVTIGEETIKRDVKLGISESKDFKLKAPEGNYQVSVTDSFSNITKTAVALTGKSIALEDSKRSFILMNYPLILLFMVIVFGMLVFLFLKRPKSLSYEKDDNKLVKYNNEDKIMGSIEKAYFSREREAVFSPEQDKKVKMPIIPFGMKPKTAELSLVTDGQKQNVSLISLKIKNLNELKSARGDALNSLANIKTLINENKGVIYESDNFLVGIFSPSLTKTFKNETIAVRTAIEIAKLLQGQNKKFIQKIDFGIGVNTGDIALKIEPNKFLFTNLGNTLPLTKKISDTASNGILLSRIVHERIMPQIRSEKVPSEIDVYKINRVIERESHNDFIRGFLRRNQ